MAKERYTIEKIGGLKLIRINTEFKAKRASSRAKLRAALNKSDQVLARKGTESDTDPFNDYYDTHGLLRPRYEFRTLYDIIEESDTLQGCIAAMVEGCDGNGHDFQFSGDDKNERNTPENQATLKSLKDFFEYVNDDGSIINVRKHWRNDMESTGNGALEIKRNLKGEIEEIFHQSITYMRMTAVDKEETPYKVSIPRGDKPILVPRKRRFRRYARYVPSLDSRSAYKQLIWFKEFGDPRDLNVDTGEYGTPQKPVPLDKKATEIWWSKIPFRNLDYGAPRWVGCVTVVKARSLAHFVNYDLFNNQGIPPMIIVVEDGQITDESLDEIENTIEAWHDPSKFNRVCIIQAEPNLIGLGQQQSKSTVKIEKLRDARAEDYMFKDFLNYSEDIIRRAFRLPPLHLGGTEAYNLATSYASQITAEQQVFAPLRQEFDEQVNLKIIRKEFEVWNWKFKSKGPKVAGSEELAKIIGTFARSGGPSMNQLIEIANEALGTDWSTYDNWFYKIPAAISLIFARSGFVTVDEAGEFRMTPPPQPGASGFDLESFLASANGKRDTSSTQGQASLYGAMVELEKEFFAKSAKKITDEDFQYGIEKKKAS